LNDGTDTSVQLLRRYRDGDPTALDELLERQEQPIRQWALGRLSDDDREAIALRVDFALPYREIARITGKPSEEAAQMAVSRALVKPAREMGRAR